MSHTFEAKGGSRFFFNGDLSGKVVVADGLGAESHVSFDDLREFVRRHESRRARSSARPPRDPEAAALRARDIEAAKHRTVELIRSVARAFDDEELVRQLFEVAVNSVKGAR